MAAVGHSTWSGDKAMPPNVYENAFPVTERAHKGKRKDGWCYPSHVSGFRLYLIGNPCPLGQSNNPLSTDISSGAACDTGQGGSSVVSQGVHHHQTLSPISAGGDTYVGESKMGDKVICGRNGNG